jgi:hypothetical protein
VNVYRLSMTPGAAGSLNQDPDILESN